MEDEYIDSYYEAQNEIPDEPAHGWPGDGSGEDDLADLMATGDEGCCDGPECDEPTYPEDVDLSYSEE